MASNCFWTDRVGVEEDCGSGGQPPASGGYIYAMIGGLFSSIQEVRKYPVDGSNTAGIRAAGSGLDGTDEFSLNFASGLAVRMEEDGLVHLYIGEAAYASHWVDGELARRNTYAVPGNFRVTAVAFDNNNQLRFGVSNYVTSPSNPPFINSNYVIDSSATPTGIGDGRWANNQFDLRSMNGVGGLAYDGNEKAWTHDYASSNQDPLYRGRLLYWDAPNQDALVVELKISPGRGDYRYLNGQIAFYNGKLYYHRYEKNPSTFDIELAVHAVDTNSIIFSDSLEHFFGPTDILYNYFAGLQVAELNGEPHIFCAGSRADGTGFDLLSINIATSVRTTIGVITDPVEIGQLAFIEVA